MKNQQMTSDKSCKVINEHCTAIKIVINDVPVLETNLPIEKGLNIKKKKVISNIFIP
jgi:hypothetical protein